MSNGLKALGALTLVFGAAGGCIYTVSPRITEREAAIKVVRGKVVDDHVRPGLKFDALLPQVDYVRLPLWQMEMVIRASEDDQQTVRTKENARIFGNYTVAFEVNNEHEDFGNIYTKLKIDDESDIPAVLHPKLNALGISAVISVYKDIPTANIDDDNIALGNKIKDALQEALNGYNLGYIRIVNVMPSGVGLSDKANADLEQIVSEQRKLDLQTVQGQVADNALALTEKQAAVTAKALEALKKAGVPDDQLISAYYLQLMRDGDHLGKPFVPGPVPGTGVGAVSAPSPK